MKPSEIRPLLPFLTPKEREELNALVSDDIARTPWRPLPGPQTMAFDSTADIVGFGGAAGGGKTDLIIGKALLQHRRSLVVRKNGTEHTAFVDRLEELLGTRDGFNGQSGIWRLNTAGLDRQLELASVPNLGDEAKYRGRPHDLKVFDEVAEIPEQQVRFLLAWMRTTIEGQRCQALLTFNPPSTAEGRWIIDFFAPWLDPNHLNPALPGELRWFVSLPDDRGGSKDIEVPGPEDYHHLGETIKPHSRTFIPSRVTDNPYLVGTGYMTQLQALPEPLRSQLLYGDFQAGVTDNPWQVIPTAWVDAAMARWALKEPRPRMEGLGVDVARGGLDNTIIARRHDGNWFDVPLTYPGKETPDGPTVAGLTIAAQRQLAPVHIDVIGVGSSPYDFLVQHKVQTIGVNVSEKALGTDQSGRLEFANRRSELWWRFRELLDPTNNHAPALPPDPRLRSDLCAPTWTLKGHKVYVQSREEVIEKIGRSPDWASAYILANIRTPRVSDLEVAAPATRHFDAVADLAASRRERARGGNRGGYDPMASIRPRR